MPKVARTNTCRILDQSTRESTDREDFNSRIPGMHQDERDVDNGRACKKWHLHPANIKRSPVHHPTDVLCRDGDLFASR